MTLGLALFALVVGALPIFFALSWLLGICVTFFRGEGGWL